MIEFVIVVRDDRAVGIYVQIDKPTMYIHLY